MARACYRLCSHLAIAEAVAICRVLPRRPKSPNPMKFRGAVDWGPGADAELGERVSVTPRAIAMADSAATEPTATNNTRRDRPQMRAGDGFAVASRKGDSDSPQLRMGTVVFAITSREREREKGVYAVQFSYVVKVGVLNAYLDWCGSRNRREAFPLLCAGLGGLERSHCWPRREPFIRLPPHMSVHTAWLL